MVLAANIGMLPAGYGVLLEYWSIGSFGEASDGRDSEKRGESLARTSQHSLPEWHNPLAASGLAIPMNLQSELVPVVAIAAPEKNNRRPAHAASELYRWSEERFRYNSPFLFLCPSNRSSHVCNFNLSFQFFAYYCWGKFKPQSTLRLSCRLDFQVRSCIPGLR